jgi:hypothetical protein
LSSLGIVFSESLSSITYLRDIAYTLVEFVEDHSPFRFLPSQESIDSPDSTVSPDSTESSTSRNERSMSFSILGMMLIGLVGITVGLLTVDYFFPETIEQTPVVSSYVDYIKHVSSSFSSWIQGFFTSGSFPQPTEEEIRATERICRLPAPEQLSRTSSGGSDITIRGPQSPSSLPTPPTTPEPMDIQDPLTSIW